MDNKNITLAIFIGMQETNLGWFDNEEVLIGFENDNTFDNLKFDKDYNWLMAVVREIEKLSYKKGRHYFLKMESAYVQICIDRMKHQPFSQWGTSGNCDKFMAIYRACVEFVEWLNKQ